MSIIDLIVVSDLKDCEVKKDLHVNHFFLVVKDVGVLKVYKVGR